MITTLPLYQVDAFTDKLFGGNPAAVIPVDKFPAASLMQQIALENNLSETAFIEPRKDGSFNLRWFTPAMEVEFCGHATIASAHVLIAEMGTDAPIIFHTQIGPLTVDIARQGYTLHAPNYAMSEIEQGEDTKAVFETDILGIYHATNNIYVEFEDEKSVREFTPNIAAIRALCESRNQLALSIMAVSDAGSDFDFVSRHFAPLFDIDEDPVTGSVHSALAPFYAKTLGKSVMTACQCSARSGVLHLKVLKDEVQITGQAVTYLRGQISLTD